jgi:hypothetical protein
MVTIKIGKSYLKNTKWEKIDKAYSQYSWLMFNTGKQNSEFQSKFASFYKLNPFLSAKQKDLYFKILKKTMRSKNPKFDRILNDLSNATGKNMFSFASKILATVDPTFLVVDSHVLQTLSLKRPSGQKMADRIRKSIELYEQLTTAYKVFLKSAEGKQVLLLFGKKIGTKGRCKLTKTKKLDFILWQTPFCFK